MSVFDLAERLTNVPDELVSGGDQVELVIEGELNWCLFYLAFFLLLGPVFPDRCPVQLKFPPRSRLGIAPTGELSYLSNYILIYNSRHLHHRL
ncbi:hypothetical protein ES708_05921 [subsurface metagenome]